MKEERISNYVKLCEEWAQRFLKMDQADLHKRVPELKEENGFLTIIHFGRRYGVSLEDGSIRSLDGQREPDTTEMLNIYTLLVYAKEGAFIMDKWVPFADLRNARQFAPAYQIGETDVFSATFSGHEKELREAFQKLDGRELPQGDVGYEIRAFDCMPMRFFFWERDEEFEAQGNILIGKSKHHGLKILSRSYPGTFHIEIFNPPVASAYTIMYHQLGNPCKTLAYLLKIHHLMHPDPAFG